MYDEDLANRLRAELSQMAPFTERKMFGGLAFLINGHMTCGIVRDELMVRTGPEWYDEALAMPHVRPMDFTGRPMHGLVMVGTEGCVGDSLRRWVQAGAQFTTTLPPKTPGAARRRA